MNRIMAMMSGCALMISIIVPASAEDGAALFVKNCQTCHIVAKVGGTRTGPPLWGVMGRKAGSIEGFKYSEGLKNSGITWTSETLDQWLTFPKKMVRDTFMLYRQNDPAIRKAIIDFLTTQKD